ncbi:MAG TPA: hypothetical protein GXX46_11270 [Peptococcaceae bacterium]|nr:hypothetical protein [Peptococcaceae bacterium]
MKLSSWKEGLKKGFATVLELGKVVFPVTVIVTILKYTSIIQILSEALKPIMGIFGLTGESAIVLVLGNLLYFYAAIGAMLTMELTVKQVYILAVMLSFSHSLLVETAITLKMGVKPWLVALIRLGISFLAAFLINIFWSGGQERAVYLLSMTPDETLTAWPDILLSSVLAGLNSVLQIAVIVIPVMIFIQILKDVEILPLLARLMSPLTRLLGVSDKTGVTLLAGLLFGIAYGAGVIIQTAKEENLSKKDIYLVSIFLVCCHAVIEDTLIFTPLGINVLYLLLVRVALAVILTIATAKFWRMVEKRVGS